MSTTGNRTARDAEEPPLVQGLIMDGIERGGSALRAALHAIDQRVLIWCWGLGTVSLFALVLVGSILSSPSVVGVLQGLFGGFMIAMLFAVAFGGLLLWARHDRTRGSAAATSTRAAELDARLAPALRELTALRTDIIAQVKARSVMRVPVGTAAGVIAWALARRGDDPPGVFELGLFVIIGALAGEYWAVYKLDRQYRRRYKNAVLPQITSKLGDLSYREASRDEVERLGALRIVPEYDSLESDDEIHGVYNGLPIRISEVRLRRRQGKRSRVVFDGVFVGITLPRTLSGTTVVLTDRGAFDRFVSRWRGTPLETVRLEHQEFEERYEVSSSDQIEARALLTPAFMERFVELTRRSGSSVPGAIAEGKTLTVALPKRMGRGDLFEPPPYWQPAGGAALVQLENDIRAVLRMAETVIALDFWSAGRQRDARGGDPGAQRFDGRGSGDDL
jgi:hypothetical protein